MEIVNAIHIAKIKNIKRDYFFNNIIHKKSRTAIKNSEKNNLKLKHSTSFRNFNEFYKLYLYAFGRFNGEPQTKTYFDNLANSFGKKFHVFEAYLEDKLVGATILIEQNNNLSLTVNVSNEEGMRLNVNNLLYWKMIEFAFDNGIDYISYGNTLDSQFGIRKFKKRMGGALNPIYNVFVFKNILNCAIFNISYKLKCYARTIFDKMGVLK